MYELAEHQTSPVSARRHHERRRKGRPRAHGRCLCAAVRPGQRCCDQREEWPLTNARDGWCAGLCRVYLGACRVFRLRWHAALVVRTDSLLVLHGFRSEPRRLCLR
jgi:hypothetical protein